MYLTSHRVVSPSGVEGLNAFRHEHGVGYVWKVEPRRVPAEDPGATVVQQIELQPGGNRVRSYLDVVFPDDTPRDDVELALNSLWLELVAAGVPGEIPNPVVYSRGEVTVRFGVDLALEQERPREFQELRNAAISTWP